MTPGFLNTFYLRWIPHPVIVTIGDIKDYIRVLIYSYYTTIAGWGVLLSSILCLLSRCKEMQSTRFVAMIPVELTCKHLGACYVTTILLTTTITITAIRIIIQL